MRLQLQALETSQSPLVVPYYSAYFWWQAALARVPVIIAHVHNA